MNNIYTQDFASLKSESLRISNKSARKALGRVCKNEKTKKEVIESLEKMDDETLLPRNTKDFKNFKGLKEDKFSKVRILYEPGKKGQLEKIVAIFDRRDLETVEKALRPHYKGK